MSTKGIWLNKRKKNHVCLDDLFLIYSMAIGLIEIITFCIVAAYVVVAGG